MVAPISLSDKSFGLTLPFDQKDYADFIFGLLGKPWAISNRKAGIFELGTKKHEVFMIHPFQAVIGAQQGRRGLPQRGQIA